MIKKKFERKKKKKRKERKFEEDEKKQLSTWTTKYAKIISILKSKGGSVTFGVLFDETATTMDALSAVLNTAKKRGVVKKKNFQEKNFFYRLIMRAMIY